MRVYKVHYQYGYTDNRATRSKSCLVSNVYNEEEARSIFLGLLSSIVRQLSQEEKQGLNCILIGAITKEEPI